jgi:hypothetical protein
MVRVETTSATTLGRGDGTPNVNRRKRWWKFGFKTKDYIQLELTNSIAPWLARASEKMRRTRAPRFPLAATADPDAASGDVPPQYVWLLVLS